MTYGLLNCRIKYKGGEEETLKDKEKKMDEIWINYCGMPVCFDIKGFSTVTDEMSSPF